MSLITCENLTLGYEGKAILSGLNFSVNSGDYLCIVGENGSGKSTLMKTLLHLQSPMSGSIILGDDLKINEIGYLPQQTALQRDFPASRKFHIIGIIIPLDVSTILRITFNYIIYVFFG